MVRAPASASRSGSHRCGNARNDLVVDPGGLQRRDFFLSAPEEQRIAAFETHDDGVATRRIDQPLVDETLCCAMATATFADRDELRALGEREHIGGDQRIVKDDVGRFKQTRRPQGQKIACAWTGAGQVDLSPHQASAVAATRRRNQGVRAFVN